MRPTVGESSDGAGSPGTVLGTTPRRGRRLWTVLARPLWALASLVLLALLCLRWLDAPLPQVVPVLQAGQPGYQALAVAMALLALVTRTGRRRYLPWVAPALVVCLVVGVQTAQRQARAPEVPTQKVGELTLFSTNVYFGQADASAVAEVVRDRDVDVLVVVEASPAFVERLDAEGLDRTHPYRAGDPRDDTANGSLIFCRVECEPVPGTSSAEDGSGAVTVFQQPAVTVRTAKGDPAGDVVVRAAHPFPPIPPGNQAWRDTLSDLDRWQRERPEPRLVLAGDFNASAGHPGFRALLRTLDDAAGASGRPLVRTWPHGRRVPPFVALDHVLTRGLAVDGYETVRVPGSDHDAVLVGLVW